MNKSVHVGPRLVTPAPHLVASRRVMPHLTISRHGRTAPPSAASSRSPSPTETLGPESPQPPSLSLHRQPPCPSQSSLTSPFLSLLSSAMFKSSSIRLALRGRCVVVPLIPCPYYGEVVKFYISSTEEHNGWMFYKCKKHNVSSNVVFIIGLPRSWLAAFLNIFFPEFHR